MSCIKDPKLHQTQKSDNVENEKIGSKCPLITAKDGSFFIKEKMININDVSQICNVEFHKQTCNVCQRRQKYPAALNHKEPKLYQCKHLEDVDIVILSFECLKIPPQENLPN